MSTRLPARDPPLRGPSAVASPAVPEPLLGTLERVFRHGPIAMALIDPALRIAYANRAYEQLFGWSLDELRSQALLDRTHPEDRHVGVAEVRELRAGTRDFVDVEKRYLRRDGSTFWARVMIFAVRAEDGRCLYTMPTIRDITAERAARESARDWRQRYETAILASRQVLYDWDPCSDQTVWAGACEQILGYRPEEMGGLEFWIGSVHPEDQAATRAALEQAIAECGALRAQYRFRHRDGRWIWVEDNAYFIVDACGAPRRLIGFLEDVSARVDAERQRRRREELFRLAADVVNGVVYEWDLGTGHVWRSSGITRVFGYAPGELADTPDAWRALVHPDDLPRVDLLEPGASTDAEYRVRHRDGRWLWVWDRASQLCAEGGRAPRLVGAAVDVTEQRRATVEAQQLAVELEARVAARTAELVGANEELEAFTYSVSHDLRAPLRHVAGFAELLRRRAGESLDAESRRYVDVIVESSARMGALLDQLLELSRLNRARLRLERVDAAALACEIVAEDPAASGRRVAWRIEPVPPVAADPQLLRIVLANLLGNALKFTARREVAHIALRGRRLDDGCVELEVSDDGVGFDMQHADRLFGVFERLHPAGEFEGWGVGLASVRRIVLRHGGTVTGRGAPGRGATFTLVLPGAAECA